MPLDRDIDSPSSVQPLEINVRPMKNKWGSCSTNGHLSFSTALLEESAGKRREVVVHELLHYDIPIT